MKLVKAQCVNCNGELEVDSGLRTAYCLYCGTKFLIDEAINHYRINHVDKIDAEVVNVYNNGGNSRGYTGDVDGDIKKVEQLLAMGENSKADEIMEDLKANFPLDCRVWFACIKKFFYQDNLYFESELDRYIENISRIDRNGGIANEMKNEISSFLKTKQGDMKRNLDENERELQNMTNKINLFSKVKTSQGEFDLEMLRKKIAYYKKDENCSKVWKIAVIATVLFGFIVSAVPDGPTGGYKFLVFLASCMIGGIVFGIIAFIICLFLKGYNRHLLKEFEQVEQSASKKVNEIKNKYSILQYKYTELKKNYDSFCFSLNRLGWF